MKYILFLLTNCLLSLYSLELKHLEENFIFESAPFSSCHAATIVEAPSGKLLVAWFGGSEEGAADVTIWASSLEGQKWTTPRQIASGDKVACWNPVLFKIDGEIFLFYKVGPNPLMWSGFFKKSSDEGKTWSDPEPMPAGIIGPVKNKPLLLPDGTLLCGSSIESFKKWGCWIDITTDKGKHWTKSAPINVETQLFGIIQPTLFFTKKGVLTALCRSHQIGFICSSTSHDQGKTWTPAKPISLPNPNSAIDSVTLKGGEVVLAYNHSKKERYPLNLAVSEEGEETWKMELTVENTPGEYSYPSIIQTQDGKIHLVYTWNRTHIKHVVIRQNF